MIVTYVLVFGMDIVSQWRIAEVARHTRNQVLPYIAAQNDAARAAERLLLFGQEIVGSRDPLVRHQARLSAQLLAYNESFHLATSVSADVQIALQGMVDLANRCDQRDQESAKALQLLLVLQNGLRSLATLGGKSATESDVTPLLVDLVNAGAPGPVNAAATAIRDRLGAEAARSLEGDLDALTAVRLKIVALEQSIATDWADISRRLRGMTDTLSVQAELATTESFSEIETRVGQSRVVTMAGIAVLAALLLGLIVCVRRLILAPLVSATEVLEAASRELPVPSAPVTRIGEIAAILGAARQLVSQTEALDAERRKVVAVRLEAAATRERDLTVLVAERTRELAEAKERAEAASAAKSIFLASVSHELRTPLNAVLGFSRLMMRKRDLAEADREHLAIINSSGEHLLNLINDVLDMAKVEARQVQVEVSAFDLLHLVGDVSDMLRVRASDVGLTLLVDLAADLPRYVFADARKLRQVLINLIDNAIKFTREGGVALRIGVASREPAGKVVLRLDIEDSGVGIAEADIERIFHPFEQAGASGSAPGTGLGLALARQFVELMGGSLTVRSRPGIGSIFRLAMPVEVATEGDIKRGAGAAPRVTGLEPGQRDWRILVVDDNPANLQLAHEQLSSVGFTVRDAASGEEAVARFLDWRPDLICMDRRMPGIDGMEATRRIRALENGETVKIIAVTASIFDDSGDEALTALCDSFLRKPYRADDLYRAIGGLLPVRYQFEGQPTETPLPHGPVDITVLPAEAQAGLREAIRLRSYSRLAELVRGLTDGHPVEARQIGLVLQSFDWPSLELLVGPAAPNPPSE